MAAYSGSDEVGERWLAWMHEQFPGQEICAAPLSLSIACHTGRHRSGVQRVRGISADIRFLHKAKRPAERSGAFALCQEQPWCACPCLCRPPVRAWPG